MMSDYEISAYIPNYYGYEDTPKIAPHAHMTCPTCGTEWFYYPGGEYTSPLWEADNGQEYDDEPVIGRYCPCCAVLHSDEETAVAYADEHHSVRDRILVDLRPEVWDVIKEYAPDLIQDYLSSNEPKLDDYFNFVMDREYERVRRGKVKLLQCG